MNRRFYAPDGEGADGHYMEVGQYPDKVGGEWFIRFYDADGNLYNVADGYENAPEAMWYAHKFRPKWRDPWAEEPGVCPACGSHDCEAPHVTVNGKTVTMWVECSECGSTHMEYYELTTKKMGWRNE